MQLELLLRKWAEIRDLYALTTAWVDAAKLMDVLLVDVREVLHAEECRMLSLREASIESGYSVSHLARLVRTGAIENVGRRYAPRVRAADVPRRRFAEKGVSSYDVQTDARTLRIGRQ